MEPAFGWAKCSVGRPVERESAPLAYLTLPTSCEQPLSFTATASSWQQPGRLREPNKRGRWKAAELRFEPKALACSAIPGPPPPPATGSTSWSTPAASTTRTIRSSPVRKAVVALPEGVTINPSVGAGLGAAPRPSTPPRRRLRRRAGCPNESKIGDFTVRARSSPAIEGAIFLAAPPEPLRQPDRHLPRRQVDRAGHPGQGRGRARAPIRTGTADRHLRQAAAAALLGPEHALPRRPAQPAGHPRGLRHLLHRGRIHPLARSRRVRGASLPLHRGHGRRRRPLPAGLAPFAPQAKGGNSTRNAGSYTPFYLHLTGTETEQEIVSYSASLPPGLLGRIAGIPYCPDAAIEAARQRSGVAERDDPSCPAASRSATPRRLWPRPVLAYAPGKLYLAGPYRGSSFSVVAIDSALVGPFDLGVVVVRSAIRDRPADRPGLDRRHRHRPDPPHHRRHPDPPARRPRLHRPPQVHPQPDQLRSASPSASALNGAGASASPTAATTRWPRPPRHSRSPTAPHSDFKPRIGLR